MGQHHGIGPHYYRGLDESADGLKVDVPLDELAQKLADMNYGVHRFLSHLIDVRKKQQAARIQRYIDRGDDDVAEYARRDGDKLIEGIEKLLNEGLY